MTDTESALRNFWAARIDQDLRSATLRLLELNVNPNFVHPTSGRTLLENALAFEDARCIRMLVEAGAARSSSTSTPLVFQALDIDLDGKVQWGIDLDFKMTFLLMELGVDYKCKDERGNSVREFLSDFGEDVLEQFDRLFIRRF